MSKIKQLLPENLEEPEGDATESYLSHRGPTPCPVRGRDLDSIVYRLRWTLTQQKIRWKDNEF